MARQLILLLKPAQLFAALLVLAACGATTPMSAPAAQRITLAGREYELEVAATPDARYQGLSDRASIPDDGGMIFVFPAHQVRVHEFVMRRCLVPIDIIFADVDGVVTATHAMGVEPYDTPDDELKRYSSRTPAQFAIELKGGTLPSLGLKPGDRLDLPLRELKRLAR